MIGARYSSLEIPQRRTQMLLNIFILFLIYLFLFHGAAVICSTETPGCNRQQKTKVQTNPVHQLEYGLSLHVESKLFQLLYKIHGMQVWPPDIIVQATEIVNNILLKQKTVNCRSSFRLCAKTPDFVSIIHNALQTCWRRLNFVSTFHNALQTGWKYGQTRLNLIQTQFHGLDSLKKQDWYFSNSISVSDAYWWAMSKVLVWYFHFTAIVSAVVLDITWYVTGTAEQ